MEIQLNKFYQCFATQCEKTKLVYITAQHISLPKVLFVLHRVMLTYISSKSIGTGIYVFSDIMWSDKKYKHWMLGTAKLCTVDFLPKWQNFFSLGRFALQDCFLHCVPKNTPGLTCCNLADLQNSFIVRKSIKLKLFYDRDVPELITWPWHFMYLIWQSLVTSSQMSYMTELFVNMVFSDRDKILIKNLHQLKGYNARQLRKKFLDKGWTNSHNNMLLK